MKVVLLFDKTLTLYALLELSFTQQKKPHVCEALFFTHDIT